MLQGKLFQNGSWGRAYPMKYKNGFEKDTRFVDNYLIEKKGAMC